MQDRPFPKYSYMHLICGQPFTLMFASSNCFCVLMYTFEWCVCVCACVRVCLSASACVCVRARSCACAHVRACVSTESQSELKKLCETFEYVMRMFHRFISMCCHHLSPNSFRKKTDITGYHSPILTSNTQMI